MSREKQYLDKAIEIGAEISVIEDLAYEINDVWDNKCQFTTCEGCKYNNINDTKCQEKLIAEHIYKLGYRKQSDNTIELPCKIGDTVYIIDEADDESGEDYVLAVKVLQFFINEHGIAIELELPLGMRLNTWMVVGENVFLTEAEAEKALAKMKGEENG